MSDNQQSKSARKACSECGYSNRETAKFCSHCGYKFQQRRRGNPPRKRCLHCGHMNRFRANVCSNCGSMFQMLTMLSRGQSQRWCPQCGKARRPTAQVCSQCGYRFKTTPLEPPIIQSEALGDPIVDSTLISPNPVPHTPNLSGEPAPEISNEELNQLLRMNNDNGDLVVRLFRPLSSKKKRP